MLAGAVASSHNGPHAFRCMSGYLHVADWFYFLAKLTIPAAGALFRTEHPDSWRVGFVEEKKKEYFTMPRYSV